jgi:hypothetical protein
MRYREFKNIIEVSSISFLVGQEILKYRGTAKDRIPLFRDKIEKETPFKTNDLKGDFIITKNNLNYYDQWTAKTQGAVPIDLKGYFENDPKKTPVTLKILKSTSSPFKLLKVPPFSDSSKFTVGSKTETSGIISPSGIGLHEQTYQGSKALFSAVINNKKLQESDVGKKVIEIAEGIAKGNTTFDLLTNITNGQFRSIRDDAMEYLGVLMLVSGHAQFESQNEFFKHIGVNSFDKIKITFPKEKNNKLSDAVATVAGFINPVSGNSIWLSVKGGTTGTGSGWSLASLKIPDNLQKSKEYQPAIQLIELMRSKENSADVQPFVLLDWFVKNNINTELTNNYSFNSEEIKSARATNQFKGSLQTLLKVVKKSNQEDFDKYKNDFKVLHYKVSQYIIKKLNEGVVEGVTPLVREILQQNFLKIGNKLSPIKQSTQNKINTQIIWPNKDLGTGKVSFFEKNSMAGGGVGSSFNKITIKVD